MNKYEAIYDGWKNWNVYQFVSSNGVPVNSRIVAVFSGEGYEVNQQKAQEHAKALNTTA